MELNFANSITTMPRAYNGIISVTSILSALVEPSYIRKWKESCEDKTYPDKVIEDARKRGSYVHLVAADYYKRNELNYDESSLAKYKEQYGLPEFDSKISRFLTGFNKFISQEEVTPIAVEQCIAEKELGYAGTPDLIGFFRNKLSLIDWKTSSTASLSGDMLDRYWMQLAAYAAMWNYKNPGNKIEQLVLVPFTASRASGLGEIKIIDDSKMIQAYFFDFLTCLDKFNRLWPLSEFYPNVVELREANRAAVYE
jgi:hypothetical protein